MAGVSYYYSELLPLLIILAVVLVFTGITLYIVVYTPKRLSSRIYSCPKLNNPVVMISVRDPYYQHIHL